MDRTTDLSTSAPPSRPRAIAALHVAAVLFGLTGLFGVWVSLGALEITLARALVASAALAIVAYATGERVRPGRALVVNGALLAVHWATFFAAVKAGGVAAGALGYATFPLFVAVAEGALERRSFDRAAATTVVLVVAGLAITAMSRGFGPSPRLGLGLGVASGVAFALLTLRNRVHVRTLPPVSLAMWQCLFASLWLVPVTLWAADARWPSPAEWAMLAILGIACTAGAHTLYIGAMRATSAHVASVIAALEPVYGIAFAALLLRQVPDVAMLCGGGLIVAAAIVASRDPGQRG